MPKRIAGCWTFLNHLKITVSNFERSKKFYSKLFKFFGVKKSFEVKGKNNAWGGKVIGWGSGPEFDLEIQEGSKKFTEQKFNRERIGLDHISFDAPSKKAVEDFHKKFLIKNKVQHWPPREFPEYCAGYYAVFFLDPDGIILEYAYIPSQS